MDESDRTVLLQSIEQSCPNLTQKMSDFYSQTWNQAINRKNHDDMFNLCGPVEPCDSSDFTDDEISALMPEYSIENIKKAISMFIEADYESHACVIFLNFLETKQLKKFSIENKLPELFFDYAVNGSLNKASGIDSGYASDETQLILSCLRDSNPAFYINYAIKKCAELNNKEYASFLYQYAKNYKIKLPKNAPRHVNARGGRHPT